MTTRPQEKAVPDSFKRLLGADAPRAEVKRIADEVMHRIELEKKEKR